MNALQRGSILASVVGIVLCGTIGGVAAWALVTAMGWDGPFGAIVAAVVGMIVATALWTAGTSLVRNASRRR
jgi:hypothetical protein